MKLIWSDAALQSLQDVANYTCENFGLRQVRLLREKIKATENKILTFPASCPLEQLLLSLPIVYRFVTIFPNLELVFHQETEETIMIDILWNTRRNAKSLVTIVNNNK